MSWASRLAAAVILLATLTGVPAARADGDPASDYLIGESVFTPYDASIPASRTTQLRLLVSEAKTRGFTIRVALIETRTDLGAILVLWRKPEQYARFLGQELSHWYRGRLLIVMPNGYGVSKNGKAVAREQAALAQLPPPSAADDLTVAAVAAVRRLARLQGIQLALPKPPSIAAEHNHDRLLIGVAVGAAGLIGLSIVVIRRRWTAKTKRR
jgi:hypothetical protein